MPAKKKSRFFDPILEGFNKQLKRFFRLSPDEREKVYNNINENTRDTFPFYLLTALGSFVITLGLIINSGAVVIGGMLITPILWPILSFSIAVTRGRIYTIQKSFFLILKASFLILIVALLVGFISPFNTFQEQVLTRTEPTLIELLIGLAAGFIGAYSASSKKIASNIGGVAISVALVPPLCVAGLTLVTGEFSQSIGAFLLYVSNLLAIIVASTMVYILEGYFTSTTDKKENVRKSYLTWSFTLLVIISIPLIILTKSLIYEQQMKNFVLQTTKNVYPEAKVSDLAINDNDLTVIIEYTIQKEGAINNSTMEKLSEIYSIKFRKPVTLNVNLIELKKMNITNYSFYE